MAIGDIKPGFSGIAIVDGQLVRCTNFNINPRQDALFYDHTIGLRDNIPGYLFEGKGDNGSLNPQKIIWRPSVKLYQGNIDYPLTSENKGPLFEHAKRGSDFNINFAYNCEIGRTFTNCKVNGYTFTATAGDICNISADIMATNGVDSDGVWQSYTTEEKIVTWDDVKITIENISSPIINGFTFTINNDCKPVYTAGGNNLLSLNPILLRVGIQEVTGTISFYNKGEILSFMEDIEEPRAIEIKMSDAFSVDMSVIFKPQERTSAISPVISQLSFVGVDFALGK